MRWLSLRPARRFRASKTAGLLPAVAGLAVLVIALHGCDYEWGANDQGAGSEAGSDAAPVDAPPGDGAKADAPPAGYACLAGSCSAAEPLCCEFEDVTGSVAKCRTVGAGCRATGARVLCGNGAACPADRPTCDVTTTPYPSCSP